MELKYRSEIDGLRALAVLPVILFHAGFSTFSGGFVGVDVFFVISGYLITSIIVKDLEAGTFSFRDFYARRARRILPALFLVLACCIPFAWLWAMPKDLATFSASVVSVCLFASNFIFWQQSGYFDTAAELKPLLHTWSLAVEEQYYIIFPMALLLAWRLGRRKVIWAIALVSLLSMALSEYASRHDPSANFYMLPTRAWELMAGALCAFAIIRQSILRDNLLACAGLAAIAVSVFAYDKTIAFPSLYALLPVLGTCATVLFARQGTLAASFLSLKPVVGIGLISYSAYLWHQPLFAFARIHSLAKPTWQLMLSLALASLVLAYLSWRFLEVPARRGSAGSMASRHTVLSILGLFTAVFIAVGAAGYINKGFPERLSNSGLDYTNYDKKTIFREGICFIQPEQTYIDFSPTCAPGSNSDLTFIWGDSHAAALSFGLRSTMANVYQLTAGGCPPIKDEIFERNLNCRDINDYVLKIVSEKQPARLIMHAVWNRHRNFSDHLERTIEFVKNISPNTKIILVGGVPQWAPDLPTFAWHSGVIVNKSLKLLNPDIDSIRILDNKLKVIADRQGISFFSMTEHLCDGDLCQITAPSGDGWELIAWDYGHSTGAGSLYMAKMIANEYH